MDDLNLIVCWFTLPQIISHVPSVALNDLHAHCTSKRSILCMGGGERIIPEIHTSRKYTVNKARYRKGMTEFQLVTSESARSVSRHGSVA